MAEASVSVEIRIERPVGEVFAVVSDYNNAVKWQDGVISSRQSTPGDPRVGSQIQYPRKIANRDFETKARITRLEADAAIRIESSGKLYTYSGGYDFAADGDSATRVTYQGTITTGRLLGPIGKKLATGFENQMTGDLGRLKKMMEAGDL